MELSFKERMQLLNILPREGSRVTGKIISEFISKLQPSAEEHKTLRIAEGGEFYQDEQHLRPPIRVPEGQIIYDNTKDFKSEIEINDVIKDIIEKKFRQMDSSNSLPFELHDLYDRFMVK